MNISHEYVRKRGLKLLYIGLVWLVFQLALAFVGIGIPYISLLLYPATGLVILGLLMLGYAHFAGKDSRGAISIATLVACGGACLAYEAIRINGWYNRFPSWDTPFVEVAFSKWHPLTLVFYLSLFLPYAVVASNKNNPKIRLGWLLVSIGVLVLAVMEIPGAKQGRWGGTHDNFLLLYWLFVVIPSIIFILIGKFANKTVNDDT